MYILYICIETYNPTPLRFFLHPPCLPSVGGRMCLVGGYGRVGGDGGHERVRHPRRYVLYCIGQKTQSFQKFWGKIND